MNSFVLCTNDNQIATNFTYLMEGKAEVYIFPGDYFKKLDPCSVRNLQNYSHFVLGVNHLTEDALSIFRLLKDIPIEKMLLVKQLTSKSDIKIANEHGVKLLIDPLEKVKYAMENFRDVIGYLSHTQSGKECHHYNGDEVYVIEKNLYYHISELWVGNFATRHYLSDLELKLLELFIQFEGKVLHSSSIADELWGGQIEESSIRKLVKRLRKKLGNPTLIVGRKQGGYIFKKRDANN